MSSISRTNPTSSQSTDRILEKMEEKLEGIKATLDKTMIRAQKEAKIAITQLLATLKDFIILV
ncbi:MAG: hypothetical protein K1060chlam4_00044 [Candidatus Anoxychlamydiales bacterium]|nr:hypothetical protein [Candidatus Anoxychlamydiales bacterium]